MNGPELPPAELDVMTCLWKQDALTAREVRETLVDTRPMAHSSVCTLLSRLIDKQLVTRRKGKNGKAFVYSAAVEPASTQGRLVCDLLDRVFAGSGVNLLASLLESRPPTSEELSDLENLIEELKRQKTRRPVIQTRLWRTKMPRFPFGQRRCEYVLLTKTSRGSPKPRSE